MARRVRGQMAARFAQVSDEEIQRRWLNLRPKALRGLGVSLLLTVATYLILHFAFPVDAAADNAQKIGFLSTEYVMTLAFQISCVFDVCIGLLAGMSFMFGSAPRKQAVR